VDDKPEINGLNYPYYYNGGGVAVADLNNDGLSDIILTGNGVPSKIYLNLGKLKFRDITQESGFVFPGWATGVTVGDVNNDGYLDIFVCRSVSDKAELLQNLLFINNGNLTFTEKSSAWGLIEKELTIHAAFLDYDNDGDLDLYTLNHPNIINFKGSPTMAVDSKMREEVARLKINPNDYIQLTPGSTLIETGTDKLYENIGGKFVEVTHKAGLPAEHAMGLSVTAADINQDGYVDLFIGNDFIGQDFLYINQRNGTFVDSTIYYFPHLCYYSMGNDIADINNDALPDLIVLDMLPEDNFREKSAIQYMPLHFYETVFTSQNRRIPQFIKNHLYINTGKPPFLEIGQFAGIARTDWSWAPLFADFDNDGYKDLFISNGLKKDLNYFDVLQGEEIYKVGAKFSFNPQEMLRKLPDLRLPNYIFQNNRQYRFLPKMQEWGMLGAINTSGAAYADLDNDGDLEIITNNMDTVAIIYKNQSQEISKNHFLRILPFWKPQGAIAFHTKVWLYTPEGIQYQELKTTAGYQSCSEPILHFGLGKINKVDSIIVVFPNQQKLVLLNPALDKLHTLFATQALLKFTTTLPIQSPLLFEDQTKKRELNWSHTENKYLDFEYERLLLQKKSHVPPPLAIGDLNGDEMEDCIIGSSAMMTPTLWLQTKEGKFQKLQNCPWEKEKHADITAILLWDLDNDSDLDIYFVMGGNEVHKDTTLLQDWIYYNDGKGNFSKYPYPLPANNSNCIAAADYDKDGDLDIFLGGGSVPGSYPLAAGSYLIKNEKGILQDATETEAPELKIPGIINAALWTDFDNDSWQDLILCPEWLPLQFYKNEKGKLKRIEIEGLEYTSGLWQSIVGGDFDNDGDTDYIVGNWGLNNRLSNFVSPTSPLICIVTDIDKNGSLDPLVFYFQKGQYYPVTARKELFEQVPSLRNQFITFSAYGKATQNDIYKNVSLEGSLRYEIHTLTSCYLENLSKGKFRLIPLPLQLQWSPLRGLLVEDFDQDGNLDILATGNSQEPHPNLGYEYGSQGWFLKGKGDGTFEVLQHTGFRIEGSGRALALSISAKENQPLIWATQNQNQAKVFGLLPPFTPKSIWQAPHLLHSCWLELSGGKKRKIEFYYGSGYHSQSTRKVFFNIHSKNLLQYDHSSQTFQALKP
ncbi:MAG: VCBS repeat-containing protein, partial [Bacteroidia bacterium]|nr:VCBS repeat-containing protein [Bacteroidia bacterium]